MMTSRNLRLTGAALGLLLCAITSGMAAPRVEVDGQPVSFSAKPIQLDSTILVPVRDLCQALGAEVYWNASTQTATATKGNRSVLITIGEEDAKVNGRVVALDVPAMFYRGATMVPMAFLARALGAGVSWSDATQTASISTGGVTDNDRLPGDNPPREMQTVSILQGTVVPVSLDTALNPSTSSASNTFTATVRSDQDGDAEFPRGTRFMGTATGVRRANARQSRNRYVSFTEARLPDGSRVPIDGSLISLSDTTVTRSSDGRLTATSDPRWGERRPTDVTSNQGTEFGVLLNRDVSYSAPWRYVASRSTYLRTGTPGRDPRPYDDRRTGRQTVVIPQATVISVSLDTALSSSTSRQGDGLSVTVRSTLDGDADFPRGTQFVGNVASVQRAGAGRPGILGLSFSEARLPDGSWAAIVGSLVSVDDRALTRSADGRLKATVESRWGGGRATDVVVDPGTVFGVRMDRDVSYSAPDAFIGAHGNHFGNRPSGNDLYPTDGQWTDTQTLVIPEGTVVPVSLDTALSSSTTRLGDEFSVTVRSSQDGDAEFPRGTRLAGNVVGVQKADRDQPGMLDLSFREAWLPDGSKATIEGSLISLDDKTVTRSVDGRLKATVKSSGDDRLKFIGIGAGAGLLIGKLLDQNLIVGGLLGAAAGYLYNEYTTDKVKPTDVVVAPGTVFGVRMDRDASYGAPPAFVAGRSAYGGSR
jgi:hypothetical protein